MTSVTVLLGAKIRNSIHLLNWNTATVRECGGEVVGEGEVVEVFGEDVRGKKYTRTSMLEE